MAAVPESPAPESPAPESPAPVRTESLPPIRAGAPALQVGWRLTHGFALVMLGALICGLLFPCLRAPARHGIVRWWAGRFLAALGIRVRVQGEWPSAPGRYLLAANHITWLDIFVIHSVHPVRFVSKSEVASWPVAGFLAKAAGTLFLDRKRKRDTVAIGAQMRAALDQGDAVGIYPEGTTSDGTVLLPFFSPLLQPAVSCDAAVVPTGLRYAYRDGARNTALAFIGEQTFLESVMITSRQPGVVVDVRFGPPIAAGGRDRRALAREVEAAVAALLDVPQAGNRQAD